MTAVAIVGAGPYGLSLAAHLRSYGIPYRIFGPPMDTWRQHVPAGMILKSDGFASNLSDRDGAETLAAYCAARGLEYHPTDRPVDLDVFNAYAMDFQQRMVPNLENRHVVSIDRSGAGFTLMLDDGEVLTAELVVAAVGITHFGVVPDELADLGPDLVSHSGAHHDLSAFAGRDVTVVGGGSSAVDVATLLAEAGAATSLVVRGSELRFFTPPTGRPRTVLDRIRRPSSGLGPGWRSWACQNLPGLFRFLPGNARAVIVRRHLGPKSGWPMRDRLYAAVTVSLREQVEKAIEEDGRVRLVLRAADGTTREVLTDHVVAATGYRPDVARLAFLSDRLRDAVRTHAGAPMLSGSFESSVPGLYFIGPPAVDSFGPLMRFMVGAEWAAPLVARRIARRVRRGRAIARPSDTAPVSAA